MKNLIGSLAITCLAATAWGQGTVNFNNNVAFATPADRLVYWSPGRPLVGMEFLAQLYYGSQGTAAGSLTAVASSPARFRVPSTSSPGTWSGGTRTLTGILPGQTSTLQVRVFTGVPGPGGGTYRLLGASALFDYTVPLPGSPPADFFMENFRGFTLVPEPPTLGLAALGALGLLKSRRRREARRVSPGPS